MRYCIRAEIVRRARPWASFSIEVDRGRRILPGHGLQREGGDVLSRNILVGKVALITGAGSVGGQGAAEARLFAAEGATVIVADLPVSSGAKVAAEIGTQADFVHLDVTDAEAWVKVVERVVERFRQIDVLVNNAGIWLAKGVLDTSAEEYRKVIEINQTGVFLGMAAVTPLMKASGSGAIINICSTAGLKGGGQPLAYAASKWAVRGMTRAAAWELAPHGVRVNAICPGVIDTPMIEGGREVLDMLAKTIPMGRVGTPDEVAQLALFLASDASGYVTGGEFAIDGAVTA
jgi:3alpha(or 20beta)-hydroxysteroid dehydrogenase